MTFRPELARLTSMHIALIMAALMRSISPLFGTSLATLVSERQRFSGTLPQEAIRIKELKQVLNEGMALAPTAMHKGWTVTMFTGTALASTSTERLPL